MQSAETVLDVLRASRTEWPLERAVIGNARARSPSSKTAWPTEFSTQEPLCPVPAITRPDREFLRQGFSCPDREQRVWRQGRDGRFAWPDPAPSRRSPDARGGTTDWHNHDGA